MAEGPGAEDMSHCGSCGGTGQNWNPMSGTWSGTCGSCNGHGGMTCERCHDDNGMVYIAATDDWEYCEHEEGRTAQEEREHEERAEDREQERRLELLCTLAEASELLKELEL